VTTSCAAGRGFKGGMDFVLRDAVVSMGGPDGITVSPAGALEVPRAPAESISIDAAFVRAVASGQPSLLRSPFDDALKSMAVTLAANLSASEGGRQVNMQEFLGNLDA